MPISPIACVALVAIGIAFGVTACSGSDDVAKPGYYPTTSTTSSDPPTAAAPSTPAVSAEDLDASKYESIAQREFALIAKNPDANKGRRIIVYGVVTQFDAATGQSVFLADTASDATDAKVDAVNALVTAPDPRILTNVVKDDHVIMWCQVFGSYSYDAVMGKRTVPAFRVYMLRNNGPYGT